MGRDAGPGNEELATEANVPPAGSKSSPLVVEMHTTGGGSGVPPNTLHD